MMFPGEDTNNRFWSTAVARYSRWYSSQESSVSLLFTLVKGTSDASPSSSGFSVMLTSLPHAHWYMVKRSHQNVSLISVLFFAAYSNTLPESAKTTFWAGKRCSAWNEKYAAFEVRIGSDVQNRHSNKCKYSRNSSQTCGMARNASKRKVK